MDFQRSDDNWIVSVRKKDFAPAAGRSNAPSSIPIGTIHDKTGALDPWPVAYGAPMLSTQSRNKPNQEWWKEMALLHLKKAAQSDAFQHARKKYREEERTAGDFIVRLSDGREDAFHDSGRAHDWAGRELEKMPAGSRAEFFRRIPKGRTLTGYPWTEPFSAMEVDGFKHVRMAGLHGEARRSGQFVSSRPWIVYKRTPRGPQLVSRFTNETRAHEHARDEHALVDNISDLTAGERRQMGLHG